ncbi:hypothetical protein [Bremerella alba]|uniref:Helix-turn-helix domain-containing protein n=1 Tax=Bremerella alba TaxID=980252 RepID=A0A7V9A587_9BACT|nr:hypothetical protein [Bremerella alba]MBA2113075.1 hypothetical protein [Bremerella alba]
MKTLNNNSGVISVQELYTVSEFKARLGISNTAFRTLRQQGLKISRIGKRAYLVGRLAIEFFESQAKEDYIENGR